MKRLIVAALIATSVLVAYPSPAEAAPLKVGDTLTYDVWADSPTVEISTYDGLNRPVSANQLRRVPNREPSTYAGRYVFRVEATSAYLAIGIRTDAYNAGCEAYINGRLYSRDFQHGYRAQALCN